MGGKLPKQMSWKLRVPQACIRLVHCLPLLPIGGLRHLPSVVPLRGPRLALLGTTRHGATRPRSNGARYRPQLPISITRAQAAGGRGTTLGTIMKASMCDPTNRGGA